MKRGVAISALIFSFVVLQSSRVIAVECRNHRYSRIETFVDEIMAAVDRSGGKGEVASLCPFGSTRVVQRGCSYTVCKLQYFGTEHFRINVELYRSREDAQNGASSMGGADIDYPPSGIPNVEWYRTRHN